MQQAQSANTVNGAPVPAAAPVTKADSAAAALANPVAPGDKPKAYSADNRGFDDPANPELYGTTTLVNDHSKVYKGGSWNDMAFWLNPAARRFMNEDDASAEIGFRCAMTLVGAPEIHPEGKPHYKVKKPKINAIRQAH
jgi:hypothetical protein